MKKTITVLVIAVMTLFAVFAFAETAQQPNRQIVITDNSVAVYIGKTAKIEAAVEAFDESAPKKTTLVWTSADPSVAKVAANGTVSGVSAGQTVITVQAKDDESILSTVAVEVRTPVKAIALDIKSAVLLVGASDEKARVALTPEISPADAYHQDVIWTSSNEKVAVVNEQGVVTAVSPGNAVITAVSTEPGSQRKATCKVTVQQAVLEIAVNQPEVTIPLTKSVTLKASVLPQNAGNRKLIWSSSDESIATVTSNGAVKGIAKGTAVITATAADGSGASASATVTVVKPVKQIQLSETKTISLAVGLTYQLEAAAEPEDADVKEVLWTSSNEKVATVSSSGLIKAVGKGSANITATATDGSGVRKSVQVRCEKYDLVFTSKTPKEATYYYGSGRFKITGKVKTGCVSIPEINTLMWASVMGGLASETVKVTPVKPGTDTITIKAGKYKTIITVYVSPDAFGGSGQSAQKQGQNKQNSAREDIDQSVNLALYKSIKAGSQWPDYPIGNANDGNEYSYWESKGYPVEVTLDLQAPMHVSEAVIRLNPDPIWGSRTQTIEVLSSMDGKTYTQVLEPMEYLYDAATGNLITIDFQTTEMQYLKFVFKDGSWENGAQAAEILVYGSAGNLSSSAENVPAEAQEYNGHYYMAYSQSVSWLKAKSQCEEMGGHLVTITSPEEQRFLEKLIKNRGEFWIGLRRVNDDSFAWITGEETSYTNWGYGEPNNYVTFEFEGENSVAMRPDWNDYHEDNTASIAGYICEWDISNGD